MDSTNKFNSMTSDYVIVSIKLCPEAGNDGWFVLCNFIGCSISSFEVLGEGWGGGGRGAGALWRPSVKRSEKKPGINRVKNLYFIVKSALSSSS